MNKELFNVEVVDLTPPDRNYQDAWSLFQKELKGFNKVWLIVHPGFQPSYYDDYQSYMRGRDSVVSACMTAQIPTIFFIEQQKLAQESDPSSTLKSSLKGYRKELEVPLQGRTYLVRTKNNQPKPEDPFDYDDLEKLLKSSGVKGVVVAGEILGAHFRNPGRYSEPERNHWWSKSVESVFFCVGALAVELRQRNFDVKISQFAYGNRMPKGE